MKNMICLYEIKGNLIVRALRKLVLFWYFGQSTSKVGVKNDCTSNIFYHVVVDTQSDDCIELTPVVVIEKDPPVPKITFVEEGFIIDWS